MTAPAASSTMERMFTIRAENRTYDLHRPKGCTLLAIEVDWWPGNEFGLWLPETVYLGPKIIWCNWEGNPLQYWEKSGQSWTWNLTEKDFSLAAELIPDPRTASLTYRYTLKNRTKKPLKGLNTQTCFHLANAPEFVSIRGERIWVNADGQWKTTDTLPRHVSPDPRRIQLARQGLFPDRKVKVYTDFPSARLSEEAHHPLIVAERFGGRGAVGIAVENYHHLFNNNDPILRCIHSEPDPIPLLKAGESATQQGRILFHKRGKGALIAAHGKLSRRG